MCTLEKLDQLLSVGKVRRVTWYKYDAAFVSGGAEEPVNSLH